MTETTEKRDELAQLRGLLFRATSEAARQAIIRKIRLKEQEIQADLVRTQVIKCRSCGLNRQRLNAVPYSGPTHGKADLILVGEAPGADEDSKGVPFVGRSGKLLDRLLRTAGTNRDKCFVANTLGCRPPNNRDPKARELAACRPNFEAQLDLADVPVGVTLGAYALANVMGKPRSSVSIGEHLDKPVWVDGRIWIPTYHPAYGLRNVKEQETIRGSILLALALRWGREVLPVPPHDQIEFDGKPGKDYLPQFEKHGWVLFHSETLNCQVVMVKDRERTKVPGTVSHLPRYSFDELVKVGVAGKGRSAGWSKRALRRLHIVRAEFDGEVIVG